MYLVSWHLCYGLGVSVIWLLDPSLPEWFVGEIQTDEQNCDWIYWFNCYIFDLFHSYSWGPKTFKTNGLHRNPVMNVLLPLNLLIESPLLKLLAVTIALSLILLFPLLARISFVILFWGLKDKNQWFLRCHLIPLLIEGMVADRQFDLQGLSHNTRNMVNGYSLDRIFEVELRVEILSGCNISWFGTPNLPSVPQVHGWSCSDRMEIRHMGDPANGLASLCAPSATLSSCPHWNWTNVPGDHSKFQQLP